MIIVDIIAMAAIIIGIASVAWGAGTIVWMLWEASKHNPDDSED